MQKIMFGILVFVMFASHVRARIMHYTGRISPAPQQVLSEWKMINISEKDFKVVINPGAHNAVKLAKDELEKRIRYFTGKGTGMTGKAITVYLGNVDDKKFISNAKKNGIDPTRTVLPQDGYLIRIVEKKDSVKIFAGGVNHRGTFYAAATLMQGIGLTNGRATLRCASVNDWPHWKHRYFADYGYLKPEQGVFLAENKIDGFTLQTRSEWRMIRANTKMQYSRISYGDALKIMKKFKDTYDLVDIMVIINIYAASPRKYPRINIANEQDIKQLADVCSFLASSGVDSIMIAADDWTLSQKGKYVCSCSAERKKFNDSVGRAHGYLVRRLYEILKPRYPLLTLSFVPAPYSIYNHKIPTKISSQRYLRDLAMELPDEIKVVWTGPYVRSKKVTRKDFLKFTDYVQGQPLLLWDNSCNGPIPRWETSFYPGFALDSNGVIYINMPGFFGWAWQGPFGLAANAYLWNPKSYNSITAHRDAVERLYGKGTYSPVNEYIKNYALLKAVMKTNKKKAKSILARLTNALEKMKKKGLPIRRPAGEIKRIRSILEAAPPTMTVVRVKDKPVIDGKLNESCWKTMKWSDEFKHISGDNKKINATKFKIGYDDSNLYIAFWCEHKAPFKKPLVKQHDGPIYAMSDAIEIFLQDKKDDYGHFIFDHIGNRFDESKTLGLSWDPDWNVAIHKEKNVWTSEVIIPFSSMKPLIEKKVKKGTVWKGNFCRSYATVHEYSCWSPTHGNSFHTTAFFGTLIFE